MQVTVEGVITSVGLVVKQDKPVSTEILLAQRGEQQQVKVRLDGDQRANFTEFELNSFTGRLMTWTARNGIGMMVMA